MNIFYVSSSNKYIFENMQKSTKTLQDIQKEIVSIPNFCREESSISIYELKSYLVNGISFYTVDINNIISGLINFDVNETTVIILGICVPGYSQGIGTYLINAIKQFAKLNNLLKIKLTCYGELKMFYLKQGFNISNESIFYDSDDDSDNPVNSKIRYDMIFDINNFIGGKRRKKSNKKRNKKSKKTYKKRRNK